MSLQVGIEEGSTSTAVCVRGLQYCLYSQKKISLITLLSDLVYSGITEIYYRKTVGHVFTKPVQIEGKT